MEERARGLDRVRDEVLAEFQQRAPLHEFYILDQRDVDYRAYVFFSRDEDLKAAHQSGLDAELIDFTYGALERAGRGRRDELKVAFEFDSHENVQRRFEGNYGLRLRT
jgi:hypothetical protein